MKTYREFVVWQKSVDMVSSIYKITSTFPKDEIYGLTNQIRRASVSIPSNIAEGFGRTTKNEFKRFCQISIGSLFELQTQLEIARNLNFINVSDFKTIYENSREVEAMLSALIKKLKT